ncbi:MAG TPA: DciA family protein [Stellaceae bacterium]|nr:DciA family protein [Stellaceae bacterium]
MSAANRQRGLAGPQGGDPGHGFRAVGSAVSKLGAPIIAKRGGGLLVRLKTNWLAIVGAEWAALTWPAAFFRDGSLKLRVAPAAALELQHRAPLIIERINVFLGRPAVTRLVLVQDPLPFSARPGEAAAPPLAAGEAAALGKRVCDIADPELRGALVRLGQAVIAARR